MTEQTEDTPDEDFDDKLEARIIHLLGIYPGIQPTMLQAVLGPQTRADVWRPVLEDMITRGIIVQSVLTATTPKGRRNGYIKLNLAETPSG